MPNENSNRVSVDDSDPRVRLAGERTLLAYERTQIAWVRTALTLISFGFAISEFFTYLRAQQGERATVLSPRAIGLSMRVASVALAVANSHRCRRSQGQWRGCPEVTCFLVTQVDHFTWRVRSRIIRPGSEAVHLTIPCPTVAKTTLCR